MYAQVRNYLLHPTIETIPLRTGIPIIVFRSKHFKRGRHGSPRADTSSAWSHGLYKAFGRTFGTTRSISNCFFTSFMDFPGTRVPGITNTYQTPILRCCLCARVKTYFCPVTGRVRKTLGRLGVPWIDMALQWHGHDIAKPHPTCG